MKITTVSEAISVVRDGGHVAVGGCLYSRTPMALLFELLRQGRRGLTLSRSLTCYEAEMFFAVDAADTIETSWVGFGGPWGMLRTVRQALQEGTKSFNEYSHLGIAMRFRGGAMGVPFLPMRSMLGSDLIEHADTKQISCPFTGEQLVAVPALQPDVGLIHAHRADDRGNVQIDGYEHMDADIARAAKHTIVTVEEIVDRSVIEAASDRTVIPHFVVDSLIEVPRGAFPHELYGMYDASFSHFDLYAERTNADGIEGVRAYIDEFVHGHEDFESFLGKFSSEEMARTRARVKELI